MRGKHTIECASSLTPESYRTGLEHITLSTHPQQGNVTLSLSHISKKMISQLKPRSADLLELASYVYAADQAVSRGGTLQVEYGAKWRRDMSFQLALREPTFWNRRAVKEAVSALLSFLSDDDYTFKFTRDKHPVQTDQYIEFDPAASRDVPEEVALFSGGLDSLGGAVHGIFQQKKRMALVSHRSSEKIFARQRDLVAEIAQRCTRRYPRPLHIPVVVTKDAAIGSSYTQRTRSFLFASLAAVVADAFGLSSFSFYENGVTSLNLAVCEQVVGSRATRTTHPQTVRGLETLLSLVFDRPFTVQTPFMFKTKSDVIADIKSAGMADLCPRTMSCAHVIASSTLHTHCGSCSQCIDRRLAELAAELSGAELSPSMYKLDPLCDDIPDERSVILAESLVRLWSRLETTEDIGSLCRDYPELSRAYRYLGIRPHEGATRILGLLRRNAKQMCDVLDRLGQHKIAELRRGEVAPKSLLGLAHRLTPTQPTPTLGDPVEIVRGTRLARVGNVEIPFSSRQKRLFSLLETLVGQEGHMVFFDRLCSEEDGVWIDYKPEHSTIRGAVAALRKIFRTNSCPMTAKALVTGTYETKPYVMFERTTSHL